jgi:hypothetical protein
VDSSGAGVGSSSTAAVLGSFPSQDRPVDFLHSTKLVINQVRLPSYKVLLGKGFHLQARPDDSHGRSAKYAGDVYKPGFSERLFFSLSCYWFFGTSSCARFLPTLHGRRLRLDNSCRPPCHLRHQFLYGGGWTVASFSWLAHRLPVISFPLINRVRGWKLLRELRIQASAYTILQDKYSATLLEELTS